jgi:hypothetical protein
MNKYLLFVMTIVSSLLTSCASIEKLADEGRYDELVYLAQKRLKGKKIKKAKYVRAIEDAFAKIQARDMERINYLSSRADIHSQDEILSITRKISERQKLVEPYLPLVDEHGYQAKFKFIKIDRIVHDANSKAASRLYALAVKDLALGEQGDKLAARRAYRDLGRIERYHSNYQDTEELLRKAEDLGITRILVNMEIKDHLHVPAIFEEEMLRLNVRKAGQTWTQFYNYPVNNVDFDYEARLIINDLHVTPDLIRDKKRVVRKKIEDGWEYQLDERGNVAKDTSGNDIKVPKYVKVKAVVLTTHQSKSASVRARIDVFDLREHAVVESIPLQLTTDFYHEARSFHGDERALKEKDKRIILPIPFPNEISMILQAANELKPIFIREISNFRLI